MGDTSALPPPPRSKRRWLVAGALVAVALVSIGVIVLLIDQDDPQPVTMSEWMVAFEAESAVILDVRTTMDEAAERSGEAASVRCEVIREDPAADLAIESITNAPDGPVREVATEWETSFRAAVDLCVAGDFKGSDAQLARSDELLLVLGEKAGVDLGVPRYERDVAFADLTGGDFGFTDEQANCILDKVEDQGLEDVVVEDDIDNVDSADVEAVTDVFGECALGDLFTEELDDAVDEAVQDELNGETG